MGNFLVFKATLQPAFAAYAGHTLQHVETNVRARFMRLHRQGLNRAACAASSSSNSAAASSGPAMAMAASHSTGSLHSSYSSSSSSSQSSLPGSRVGNYGFELDFSCFTLLFPTLSREEAVANFNAWDTDRDGVIDMLELVSGMVLLAAASFEDKVRALFDLYDFDDSGGLAQRELLALVLGATGAWDKMLGTERGKGRDVEEMNEAARRAFTHLCIAVPRRKPGSRGAGGGSGRRASPSRRQARSAALDEEGGGAKFMLVSPPGPHVAGGGGGEVPLDKLLLFCACVPLLLQNLCRHHTTDGEAARSHWTRLLAAAGNELATHTGGRGQSTAALLRQECNRVQQLFHSWVPYHRQLVMWQAAQRRAAQQASMPASSSAKAAEAAAAAAATIMPDLGGRGGSLPGSPHHGGGSGSGGSVVGPPGSASKSRSSGAMSHLLDDVQSKLTLPTYSSLAKDKRTEGVHHDIKTSLWRPGTASGTRPEGEGGAAATGSPTAPGSNAGTGAGAGDVSPPSSPPPKRSTMSGLDDSLLSGNLGAAELEDLRHRPAYLAIKRIKSKVGSRRAKGDPHFAHYMYDKATLRQAKAMFDSIDRDGSGEIEIAELSSSLEGNPHLGAAISAFKSLDVDQTGSINFGELLRALFPLASGHHVQLMCIEVRAIEIGRRDLQLLQQEFEWLDSDFDGRVKFKELLARLRDGWRGTPSTPTAAAGGASTAGGGSGAPSATNTPGGALNSSTSSGSGSGNKTTTSSGGAVLGSLPKQYARDYTPSRSFFSGAGEDRLLTFQECMIELFSRSHAHMIGDIRRWAAGMNVAALTDRQHVELEQLFEIYDLDHSGSIEMHELVSHFSALGFTESDNARLFRLFDRDGGGSIDLTEFKRFYRTVFDSTKAEDYGRGVTTY